MVESIPGGVYLCQVGDRVSCGACCGLYNMRPLTRATLEEMLADRTMHFSRVERTPEALLAFAEQVRGPSDHRRPFPEFHHCSFLGLIETGAKRVGCLLHPEADGNGGIDYRGLSYYGGMACRIYFCPAHRLLPEEIKIVVREAADHWYDYGLMITEAKLLTFFFEDAAGLLGKTIRWSSFQANPKGAGTVRRLLGFKREWPYRRKPDPGPCNYFFEDRRYRKPGVRYPSGMAPPPRHHRFFRELYSEFTSAAELRHAERIVDEMILSLVEAAR